MEREINRIKKMKGKDDKPAAKKKTNTERGQPHMCIDLFVGRPRRTGLKFIFTHLKV